MSENGVKKETAMEKFMNEWAPELETVADWKELFIKLVPESVLKDYMQNPEKVGKVANYEIISRFEYEKTNGTTSCVVLGKNEHAASPYATWAQDHDGGYSMGHYFAALEAAKKDMADRVSASLEVNMREEFRKENALADIEAVLEYGFESEQVKGLLKNEAFMEKAMHRYDNMDHSGENEMLQQLMEDLHAEMVKNHEIFDFEVLEKIESKKVNVELLNGTTFIGESFVNLKEQLGQFFIEGKTEDGQTFSEFVKIGDIKSLSVEGEEIYPNKSKKLVLMELRGELQQVFKNMNGLFDKRSQELQEKLLQYVRMDGEMADKVLTLVEQNEVLYKNDKKDMRYLLSSKQSFQSAFDYYEFLDTAPREHFMEMLETAFREMYPFDVEKRKGLNEKIQEASGKVGDSAKSEMRSGKEVERG